MEVHTDDSESGSEDGVINIQKLCRLCAIHDSCLIPLNEKEGKRCDLVLKIRKHLPIEMSDDDNMPHSICCTCASALSSWHSFYMKFIKAQKKLKKLARIAIEDRMSTKENQHKTVLPAQQSEGKKEQYLNRSGSKQSSNKSIDSNKPEKSRNQSPEKTEMLCQSTSQMTDNQDIQKIETGATQHLESNKKRGDHVSVTTKPPACLNKCENNLEIPRRKETKVEMNKNFESENLYVLSEKNVCFGTNGKMLTYVCGHCSKTLPDWRSLDIHLKLRHKTKTFARKSYSQCIPKDSYVKVFYCKVCDKSFLDTEKHFMLHMRLHETCVAALVDHDYW